MAADKVVLAGYLVRCPLGGYAWQNLHYLLGLRAAGFDAYFYEDTAFYAECFDPASGAMHVGPENGVAFAAEFFARHGFGARWVFWDARRDRYHGLSRAEAHSLLQDARIAITLAAVNRLAPVPQQAKIFIDVDPTFTQIRLTQGDAALRDLLAEHQLHFTFGENIGDPGCAIPTGGIHWKPTRQPIAVELWPTLESTPGAAFTTIGRWDERQRDVTFQGQVYAWSKRTEWMRFLDLPRQTGQEFSIAMDVNKVPGDDELLRRHGWSITDPIVTSRDADAYRQFIQRSKGEFTVAKDLNVRLASGWFSDRSACYLAAGRPVVTQDTGFGRHLPVGEGLFAFKTLAEAVDSIRIVASDPARQREAARRIAREHFNAGPTLRRIVDAI